MGKQTSNLIPEITLCGTEKEMGLSFGESFRDSIQEFAQTRIHRLMQYIGDYCGLAITEKELIKRVRELIPCHQQYDTKIWQELCGIATGANISQEMLLIATGYTDLRDYLTQVIISEKFDIGGCSAFIVPDQISSQGVLCGQTWDMTVESLKYLVLVRRQPRDGVQTLYLTTVGSLGLIGMNEHGISVGNTNLMAKDNQVGVHYLFTISKALRSASLNEAVEVIVNTQRLAGHNFFVADEKQGINIEATSMNSACNFIQDQPHVQTNHYLDPQLKKTERDLPENIKINTHFRYDRMKNHFQSAGKIWDAKKCWAKLADDTRHELGAAICNEDYTGIYGDFATLATVILVPKERTLWICAKGAKSGAAQIVSIG